MLQPKQLQKLFEIIDNHEQTLQQIEQHFLVTFNQNLSVFNASFTLSHLLNHNLLTLPQRISSIFLLVQNYKTQGIKRNPFGATILSISQKTCQLFERRMISDLLLDGKRQKYSKMKVEELFDEQQLMIDNMPERPQMKKMREEFMYQLPHVSQSKNAQIYNIIPDSTNKNKPVQPPEQFDNQAIKTKELQIMGFSLGKMRPIPSFIEISPFQMNWISPGVIADVHWDNIVDIEKKLAKIKGHIKKGLQTKLSKQQSTQIDRCLQNDAYAVLNLDLTPQNIILLINNNPYVAVSFLAKLGNYTLIGDYLQSLLDAPIGINCIDVVVRLIKVSKIPTAFVETFTLKNLKQSQEIPQNNKDKLKMGRVIAKFLLFLSKNNVINLRMYSQDIKAFVKCYTELEDVQELQLVMTMANQT